MKNLQDATERICELKGSLVAMDALVPAVIEALSTPTRARLMAAFDAHAEAARTVLLYADVSDFVLATFERDVARNRALVRSDVDAKHHAAAVGQVGRQIVLGKHSGRHAFADTLEKMGISIHGDALNQAFSRFKELADRKVEINEDDLEAIVAEEVGQHLVEGYALHSLEVAGGTVGVPRATVVVVRGGDKFEATSEGNGMIDATCAAIRQATGVDATLIGLTVSSVTSGIDALGDVVVQLEGGGIKVSGRGVSTDVVEASARAYVAAVSRLVRIQARHEERQVEVGP